MQGWPDQFGETGIVQLELLLLHLPDSVGQPIRSKLDDLPFAAVEHPFEFLAASDRPVDRIGLDAQLLLDLLHQVKRVAGLAVHLIDEGKNWDISHDADLEKLAGLRLYPFCRVDHHNSRIRRHQGAVGVLRKILMPRGVEDVDTEAVVIELHNRRGDRNPALLFNLHPVGNRVTRRFFPLDRTCKLDRSPIKQEFFSQGGFSRIRMRDDCERPAAFNLFLIV